VISATADPCATANVRYKYLDDGNLLLKADVSSSNYTYHPQHPHAVQTAGKFKFDYDANGNQILRDDGVQQTSIQYTAFDQPTSFMRNQNLVGVILYDANQNRVFRMTTNDETIYIDDLFEQVTNVTAVPRAADFKYFVHTPDAVAAVVVKHVVPGDSSATTSTTKYLHNDNLGSVDVVTNPGGTVAERRSYDAFGNGRNPSWTSSGGPTFGTSLVPNDYAGHEKDIEFGLVNMRGRLYDPVVGRFTAADPIVTDRTNGQRWNRYSYVLNNPLRYTDPSGFDEVDLQHIPPAALQQLLSNMQKGENAKCNSSTECLGLLRKDPTAASGNDPKQGNATKSTEDASANGTAPAKAEATSPNSSFVGGNRTAERPSFGPPGDVPPAPGAPGGPGGPRADGQRGPLGTGGPDDGILAAHGAYNWWEYQLMFHPVRSWAVSTGAITAMYFGARALLPRVPATGRVFWDSGLKTAAQEYAKANSGVTVNMTLTGRVLTALDTPLTGPYLRPFWDMASKAFAQGAVGPVTVVVSSLAQANPVGTWARVELQTLLMQGNQIIPFVP
jgi:RHS repeat-associated protein